MIFLLISRTKGKNKASTNTQYTPANFKTFSRLGRQMPFSQRQIMPVLLILRILATSICFNPIAFLYFRRQLGIFLRSTFFISSLVNGYTFQNRGIAWQKQGIKNCLFRQLWTKIVEKMGIKN